MSSDDYTSIETAIINTFIIILLIILIYVVCCCFIQCCTSEYCISRINNYRIQKKIKKSLSPIHYLKVYGDICSICLEYYQEEEDIIKIKKCNHNYHRKCISTWLMIKSTCPLCIERI